MTEDLFLDYDLPPQLIAQEPCSERDSARLMVVSRAQRFIAHRHVRDLPELLTANDLLILNNTRVLPARLLGQRARTGGKWEGLFLRQLADGAWEMLCQTRGKPAAGETIIIEPPQCESQTDEPARLELNLIAKLPDGHWQVQPQSNLPAARLLDQFGHVPLPPYIRKGTATAADRTRYQTVFAEKVGAVAAPTAGLHFTPQLFERLRQRGIAWAFVTLHVGLGTFQPLQNGDVTQHRMHSEWGELPAETAAAIQNCRQSGGRVIAIGTTSVRVLETAGQALTAPHDMIAPWSGATNLYIHPPYRFRLVDALMTNFHLPRTTLLLMVDAFAGSELVRMAYTAAIAENYRFFSYGDAMFLCS